MFIYKKAKSIVKSQFDREVKTSLSYTIVSACYNVSKYIDDFIISVVNQSLDFSANICLVLVNDGSTDNTEEKIRYWQAKYPKNIKTIFKENGGQSSARNLGMTQVNSEWVTFTDPDDFLDRDYFKNIDNFLKAQNIKELSLICTNIIFYKELNKSFADNHPLSYKFTIDERILNINSLSPYIQLHASSALFKTSVIREHKIVFPEIKPNFEDAYFVCQYFINTKNDKLALLKNSKYYYRKRSDCNSSLDLSWNDSRKYSEVFVKGYIPILLQARKHKDIRELLESIVLYSLLWQINYVLNDNHDLIFLSDEQKQLYLFYLDKCFTYMSETTIYKFSACGMNHYLRSGIINCFKKDSEKIPNLVSIEKFDLVKNEVLLKYCYVGNIKENFYINNKKVYPTNYKLVRNTFLSRTFINQKLVWIPVDEKSFSINVTIDNEPTKLFCEGLIQDSFSREEIIDFLSFSGMLLKDSGNAPWIFVDRIDHADDNAEHLYRYIKNNKLKNNIYFALAKDSDDWKRLADEGFDLVDFGSKEHQKIFNESSKIISSQIDIFVIDYWKNSAWRNKQIIFLRHGISKDDASIWLNAKKRIDLLISTTIDEYHSIVDNNSRYLFTNKEVKLLGLCRYDSLKKISDVQNTGTEKQILVFPTWRNNLFKNIKNNVEETLSNTEEDFKKVTSNAYFKNWHDLLVSDELKKLTQKLGYKIVFYAHAKVYDFLKYFEIPEYIQIEQSAKLGLQRLFAKSSMLVTDYSSVAFDMGYLNKPILYFQFDKETFWEQQSFRKGYFSYDNNGLGRVCLNYRDVIDSLKVILENNCINQQLYKDRIDKTYYYRDNNNCDRNYKAIVDLDIESANPQNSISFLYSKVLYLLKTKDWLEAINTIHSENVSNQEEKQKLIDLQNIIKARIELEKGCFEISSKLQGSIEQIDDKVIYFAKTTKILLLILQNKFKDALEVLQDEVMLQSSCQYAQLWNEIQIYKSSIDSLECNQLKQKILKSIELLPNKKERNICLDYMKNKYLGICTYFILNESDNPELLFLNTLRVNAYYKLVSHNLFLGMFALHASMKEHKVIVQQKIKDILRKEYGLLVEQIEKMLMLI